MGAVASSRQPSKKKTKKMERTFVRTCSLVLILLVVVSSSLRYELPTSSTGSRGLRLDGAGRVYVSAGSSLYRLSSDFVLEERRNLTNGVVNISLSTNGRWLVVCLTDLSCEVYNATNLADQPVFRRENAVRSSDNVALFAAEDSFYVGSISDGQQDIFFGQYTFSGNQNGVTFSIGRSEFNRNMYGGFIRGDYAYYFAVDNDPRDLRNVKAIRVCHNSNFGALYELSLFCSRAPSADARITGISLVDNFGGISGPTVVISRNRPMSTQNYVCLYNLDTIDSLMDEKYNTCSTAGDSSLEQIDIAWIDPTEVLFCKLQQFNVSLYASYSVSLHS